MRDTTTSDTFTAIDMEMQLVLPSKHQSAEWCIMRFKRPFSRLRLPISAVSSRRSRVLRVCVNLLNLRSHVVGLNQIRNTYDSCNVDKSPWMTRFIEKIETVSFNETKDE